MENRVIAPLVGKSNEAEVLVNNYPIKALIDTGSSVTTLAHNYYEEHLQGDYPLHSLETLIKIESAAGTNIPYLGYIAVPVQIPGLQETEVTALVVIVPDTDYSNRIPMLLGTGVLQIWLEKSQDTWWSQTDGVALTWQNTFRCLGVQLSDSPVQVLNTSPFAVAPGEHKAVSGLARGVKDVGPKSLMLETGSLPGGLLLAEGLVDPSPGNTSRVPLRIWNPTGKTITVPGKAILAHLHQVKDITERVKPAPAVDGSDSKQSCLNLDFSQCGLSIEEQEQAHALITKWDSVFSKHPLDLGHTTLIQHEINLKDDTPFKDKRRRIPPGLIDELRQHLKEMLACGAIQESNSPWCSNIVCVRKSDGTLRVCQDFRRLNERTIPDAYAIPRFEEATDVLSGSTWFSTLDLRHGYLQVDVAPKDIPKTAFAVGNLGFYECPRLPFGLSNAPASFQRLMERVFKDLNMKECCIYLDDILVFSSTVEEHLERLDHVFASLQKHR